MRQIFLAAVLFFIFAGNAAAQNEPMPDEVTHLTDCTRVMASQRAACIVAKEAAVQKETRRIIDALRLPPQQ